MSLHIRVKQRSTEVSIRKHHHYQQHAICPIASRYSKEKLRSRREGALFDRLFSRCTIIKSRFMSILWRKIRNPSLIIICNALFSTSDPISIVPQKKQALYLREKEREYAQAYRSESACVLTICTRVKTWFCTRGTQILDRQSASCAHATSSLPESWMKPDTSRTCTGAQLEIKNAEIVKLHHIVGNSR